MQGEKIVGMFNDLPLSKSEERLFVNREDGLTKLTNIGRFMQNSIYGIAGETGCGKTTLLNMLKFPKEIEKIIIAVTEKESKEVIIADLLHKLCEFVIKTRRFQAVSPLAKRIINFLEEEEVKVRGKAIRVGKIVEGESRWSQASKHRYNITAIRDGLGEVIDAITKQTKIVLCIDEIDKERKKDVIVILDSVKDVLKFNNLSSIVTLPPVMYQKYLEDRVGLFSEENLENILKDILPVGKLGDDEIREMLKRRTWIFPEVLPAKVKDVVTKFADGNPREALLLCQNAILSKKMGRCYKKEDFILKMFEVKAEASKFLRLRVANFNLTPKEEQLLRAIYNKDILTRKELLNSATLKIAKSTGHKAVKNLLAKRALIEIEPGFYRLDKRLQLYYQIL